MSDAVLDKTVAQPAHNGSLHAGDNPNIAPLNKSEAARMQNNVPPETYGLTAASHLLGTHTESTEKSPAGNIQSPEIPDRYKSIQTDIYFGTADGMPTPEQPGVKPDAATLAPRQDANGKVTYNPLALPGTSGGDEGGKQKEKPKTLKYRDGSVQTSSEGQLKDGYGFWPLQNTYFQASQKVAPNGDLIESTIRYVPPKEMAIRNDAGGSETMTVSSVHSYWDSSRSRYISVVMPSEGPPKMLSVTHDGGAVLPYGMVG